MKTDFQNITLNETECVIMKRMKHYIDRKEKASINVIAKECFVSTAYIIKFTKKLGYTGFSEMYYNLLAKDNSQVTLNFKTFDDLTSDSIDEQIEALCDMLKESEHNEMLITSMGYCDHVASYFLQKLWTFGFHAIQSYHVEAYISENHKPGIMFAFSSSGSLGGLIGRCKFAKLNGYTLVAITSNHNSPLAKLADMSIEIKCAKGKRDDYEPDFFSAKIIVLIELMLSKYSKKYLVKPNTK